MSLILLDECLLASLPHRSACLGHLFQAVPGHKSRMLSYYFYFHNLAYCSPVSYSPLVSLMLLLEILTYKKFLRNEIQ